MSAYRVVWPERGVAALEAFEPGVPELGQLLIGAELSLVSPGTERAHLLALPNTPSTFPAYPGYNSVGTVLESQGRFAPGTRVFSYSPHASQTVVDDRMAVAVPEGLDSSSAAFGSLVAIALQGVRKANVELGSVVAVMGAGLIGLFAMQWALAAGAADVIVIDPVAERRDLARTLGATATAASWESVTERPTIVIDATGAGESILGALELCAPRGSVVILGSPRGTVDNVNFYSTVHLKGLQVIGAHDYVRPATDSTPGFWTWADDAQLAMRFLADGRILTDSLTSTTYSSSEIPTLYADLLGGTGPMVSFIDWRDSDAEDRP